MITVDTLDLKRKMFQASIVRQEALIGDFKIRIQNILETSGLGNEEEYDNNEMSQKIQRLEELGSLNEGLKLANEEMEVLLALQASVASDHAIVSPGAVVVTNRDTFLVSVSTEQFDVDGKTFTGISAKSPVYLSMKGKAKGDAFSCKGITYKILDVF